VANASGPVSSTGMARWSTTNRSCGCRLATLPSRSDNPGAYTMTGTPASSAAFQNQSSSPRQNAVSQGSRCSVTRTPSMPGVSRQVFSRAPAAGSGRPKAAR
jgi:hypothetical protein